MSDSLHAFVTTPYPHSPILARADKLTALQAGKGVYETLMAVKFSNLLPIKLPEADDTVIARGSEFCAGRMFWRYAA